MAITSLVGNDERISLSPDAQLAAYTVHYSDNRPPVTHSGFLYNGVPGHAGGAEICVTSIGDSETRVLTPGWGSSWCPKWSPDSKRLAFYSDRDGEPQVWLWDRISDQFSKVCKQPICVLMGFEGVNWLPDSRRLVAKLRAPDWHPPKNVEDDGNADSLVQIWQSPPGEKAQHDEGWRSYDSCRGDLALIDTLSGEVRFLSTKLYPSGVRVSSDGNYIAAMSFAKLLPDSGNAHLFDLHLWQIHGGSHFMLAQDLPEEYGTAFSWSPTSSELAYTTCGDGAGELVVINVDGSEIVRADGNGTRLSPDDGYPPLWSPDGQTIYCTNGKVFAVSRATGEVRNVTDALSRYVFGIVHNRESGTVCEFGKPGSVTVMAREMDTLREGMFRLSGSEPEQIIPEQNRLLVYFILHGDCRGDWMVGQVEDAVNPRDLWALNLADGTEQRLTSLNPHLDSAASPVRRLISYKGPNDETLRASLLLSADYEPGRTYPTVLDLYYGLPNSQFLNSFNATSSWLTEHGYAVAIPDMNPSDQEPAQRITELALAAADAVVEQGFADPKRLAVIGQSLGGYSVGCVVTHTDRFSAAVAQSGFYDLVSMALHGRNNVLSGSPWVEGGFLSLGATLWEARQRYIENSPVFYIDQAQTPLLLIHGTADGACPVQQAEEMYNGLLRLNKTAVFVRYPGEDHAHWSAENEQSSRDHILKWFNRFLLG